MNDRMTARLLMGPIIPGLMNNRLGLLPGVGQGHQVVTTGAGTAAGRPGGAGPLREGGGARPSCRRARRDGSGK